MGLRNTLFATLGLGLALGANVAQAVIFDRNGNKLPDAEVNSSKVNWEILSVEKGRNYNGIGLLEQSSYGICTAFFVDTQGSEQAPAYAVTNGHCYDGSTFPSPQEILINQPSNLIFKLNYFQDGIKRVRPVRVQRIVYATMKGTDITVLELDTSFKQLVKEGFTPLKIEQVPAPVGEPVEILGIPLSGMEPSQSFLHRAVCEVGQSVNLREDVYQWEKSIRNRCSLVGGMSGSPVVSLRSNRVVAIANTGVDDDALSQPQCSLNRPCEVSRDGKVTTLAHENYAQRVSDIPSCFDQKGVFNLNLPSCRLEKP
ncbi:serine protease [Allocoleopsis sp.]|uniref:S1 family peptidase n=1 Tax=Allocoleopsis sp. TaxID=3088169 RepID=UPI002FCFE759